MATTIEKKGNKEETRLILLSQKEDEEAFSRLIYLNCTKMKSTIKSFGSNDDLCDEIFQKTIIKIWRNIKSFQFKSSFYTWYYRISLNLFIDEKRKTSRRIMVSLDSSGLNDQHGKRSVMSEVCHIKKIINPSAECSLIAPSPYEVFQKKENEKDQKEYIYKILSLLSEKHREVLWMYEYEGKSYDEMAKKFKCSVGTIMSRLFYARINARKVSKRFLAEIRRNS